MVEIVSEEETNKRLDETAIKKNLEAVLNSVRGQPVNIHLTKRNGEYQGQIIGIITETDEKHVYIENNFKFKSSADPSLNYFQKVFRGRRKIKKDRIETIDLLTEKQRYETIST